MESETFAIDDHRIIRDKGWFFAQGREKRIAIAPQNFDLILECLSHAFEASE